jgi:hypothetical protein
MVLVGGPAVVEAVRTNASTFGIWAIIAVAMICLAIWLVSIYIADSKQTRLSRLRRQLAAPAAAVGEAAAPTASIPGQRRDSGQPEPENAALARGRNARPGADYAATDSAETGSPQTRSPQTDSPQTRSPQTDSRETDVIRTDFRADGPLTHVQTEAQTAARSDRPAQADAPTRPDLPAQEPAPMGRHAMPTQRTGESDRAERTFAGPDANSQDDQDQR